VGLAAGSACEVAGNRNQIPDFGERDRSGGIGGMDFCDAMDALGGIDQMDLMARCGGGGWMKVPSARPAFFTLFHSR